jgi:hypothetical protein
LRYDFERFTFVSQEVRAADEPQAAASAFSPP